jgi:integrase
MARQRKEVGIRRKRNGWQAFIDVNGQFRSRQFPLETPIAGARVAMRKPTVIPPAADRSRRCQRYLAKPEIAAMPSIQQRAAHLDLWLTALGRDRSRTSITRDEVEAVLQRWLAAGLAAATVYHRRTALGSCCATLGGHNPVTGTTRPDHYRPVDRSIPFETIEKILAEMPAERFLKKGITAPSLSRLRVAVIAATGIPPAELMKLRPHHFDRENAMLHTPWREKGAGTPAHRSSRLTA